jgi:hypothetical protein
MPVHHPWSFKSVRRYVKKAIWLLPDMDSTGNWYFPNFRVNLWIRCYCFIENGIWWCFSNLSFRYKPGQVYLEKDLILPYVANVDFCDARCLSEINPKRSTLLFFRGRLKRNAVSMLWESLLIDWKVKLFYMHINATWTPDIYMISISIPAQPHVRVTFIGNSEEHLLTYTFTIM